jgi:hypothetical protein
MIRLQQQANITRTHINRLLSLCTIAGDPFQPSLDAVYATGSAW